MKYLLPTIVGLCLLIQDDSKPIKYEKFVPTQVASPPRVVYSHAAPVQIVSTYYVPEEVSAGFGAECFRAGVSPEANPYVKEAHRVSWLRGWVQEKTELMNTNIDKASNKGTIDPK